MKNALNIPNQITVARLILAIVFFVVLTQYVHGVSPTWKLDLANLIFIIAAGTDFVDGYLARKWGQVTPLGRVLDPMVDKVLICGCFILFLDNGFENATGYNLTETKAWMVLIIVGRELLITGLRGFNEAQGVAFGAGLHGKIKMWLQCIAAPVILFLIAHEGVMTESAATAIKKTLMWATVIVTALSMGQYLARSRYILDSSAK